MNLERLLELVFSNPNDINIQYSNINGDEKLIVNGEDLTKQDEPLFDDTEIKNKVAIYKANIELLSDDVFDKVIAKAEEQNFNLNEMNKGLELDSYTEQDALYAENVIILMSSLIHEVLLSTIQEQLDLLERF